MSTPQQRIREVYGFDFPDDFFRFAEFLKQFPRDFLQDPADMRPNFPFDLIDGKSARTHPDHPAWESRYYNDLPEFTTLFGGGTDGLHWGYHFDAPGELPPIVVHYWARDTFEHAFDGDTLFEAVRRGLEDSRDEFEEMQEDEPEESHYPEQIERIDIILEKLISFAGFDPQALNWTRHHGTSRWRRPTAMTADRVGIVVPEHQYYPHPISLFSQGAPNVNRLLVERLIREAREDIGQGYPGVALQRGRDIWLWADDFPECDDLLDEAYAALGREPLRKLLREAQAFRKHCDSQRTT